MKRFLAVFLAFAMMLSCTSLVFAEDGSLSNFKKAYVYESGIFTDVKEGSWYADSVKAAYEMGLMSGSGDLFKPSDSVSFAETVTLAARLHSIYTTGSSDFEEGKPWYKVYVDYALANGLITEDVFWDYSDELDRESFVAILTKALPKEAFPAINTIESGLISDVDNNSLCKDQIYMLYNAGVLAGIDHVGTFDPYNFISRSEAATIVARMADVSLRESFELEITDVKGVLDRNYDKSMGIINGKLKCLFAAPNREKFYIFSAPATDELRAAFDALDVFDDDYEKNLKLLILSAEDAVFEDAEYLIPDQSELDKYVGKTIAELEADGFSEWGYLLTDDYLCYTYSNDVFECDVEVDLETGSMDEPATYVITKITFSSLSQDIINEPVDINAVLERVNSEGSVRAFYDNGFAIISTEPDGSGEYRANFTTEIDGEKYFYKVVFEFTEADKAEYDKIEALFDEDFERYFNERETFFSGLKIKEVKDLSMYLPKEGQFDKYIGGTLEDLEADGFVVSEDSEDYAPYYVYENEYYMILAVLDEATNTLSSVFYFMMK